MHAKNTIIVMPLSGEPACFQSLQSCFRFQVNRHWNQLEWRYEIMRIQDGAGVILIQAVFWDISAWKYFAFFILEIRVFRRWCNQGMIEHIFALMKTCEIRCRPQSARLHTLWTAVLIGIAVNPVFDAFIAVRIEMARFQWTVYYC